MLLSEKLASAREVFSSPRAFVEAIRTDRGKDGEEESGKFGAWSNKDLDPSPPSQRNWTSWSFLAFQFSIAFSPTTYNVGASLYAIGLNWWIIFVSSSGWHHFS